ncbi:NADH dehydrogenase [ubiquinone] 1 beta subcomplex subunit 9-like [Phyllostomus hastatus]|uniref:NADH dehydrogenase [ubiquinone] 1 beta subcomplex subunit 9-like n=1 Tax=Phyllostomus hastatus TaxID=9423 RepID=UPI001E67E433|nr:NADH dehydrogenase [ubiquinone] 1 beta subcomplex subunit 9-like [Phyllostomus hastatus]
MGPTGRDGVFGPVAYLTHQQKVFRLYKQALRHLESWCIYRDKYWYFACLMRAWFEEHKNETDMVKATQLLREAEKEFWHNQHPQPYIFLNSPGGTSYERYKCYKVPEWCLDDWHPTQKAMYPDYFARREQWKKLRRESWEREVKQLQQETLAGGPSTEALPPARNEGDLPPLWWHIVTRPQEWPTWRKRGEDTSLVVVVAEAKRAAGGLDQELGEGPRGEE